MKKQLFAIAFLASTFGVLAETPFYITGDLGGTITPNAHLSEFFGPVAPGSTVKFDPGFRLGIAGGYRITEWLAAEVNSGVMSSKISSVTGATTLRDTYLSNIPLQAGLRLQWPHFGHLVPFVGASAGADISALDIDHLTVNGINVHGDQGDAVFAWQAFGGLRYSINEHMGVGVEYHYFASDSADWTARHVSGTPTDHLRFGPVDIHSLSVAFEYRF